MDEHSLQEALEGLPLDGFRYSARTGSTNDVALAWLSEGAPDWALVYAEEQTAGRGRGQRTWFTPPGAALAFSLVFRPLPAELPHLSLFSALGALAVSQAVEDLGFHPEIKWPNDVLLRRRKVCGILAESTWSGNQAEGVVLGIGINIKPGAVPQTSQLTYPATCLEAEAVFQKTGEVERALDRPALLRRILQAMLGWRPRLGSPEFLQAWEVRLAFRGEQVEIWGEDQPLRAGQVEGLAPDGSLRLKSPLGDVFTIPFGEIHLRPVV